MSVLMKDLVYAFFCFSLPLHLSLLRFGVRIILALLNELRNPPSFLLIPWNKLNATGVTGSFGKTCLLNLWGLLSFLKWGRSMKIDNLDSLLHLSGLSALFRVFYCLC